MFHYSEQTPSLIGFAATSEEKCLCRNALVLIPGLGEGMMSMAYTEALSSRLLSIDVCLVQVNLSSSFNQYGFSSLKKDCEELTQLVQYLYDNLKFETVSIVGHSTGAQDALYFMRNSRLRSRISSIITQAGVGDRDYFNTVPITVQLKEEATELQLLGKNDTLLSKRIVVLDDAPITAERFLSLTGRLTEDDMFSVELTSEELQPIVSSVDIPIALCYSSEDEFVPDKAAQRGFADRLAAVLKASSPRVELRYFTGDHGLSKPEFYEPFVDYVCAFISSL